MSDPSKPAWTFRNPEAPATPEEGMTLEVAPELAGTAWGLALAIYEELKRRGITPRADAYQVTIRSIDIWTRPVPPKR